MHKLLTTIVLLLAFSSSILAQEIDSRKHINTVHKLYIEKLKLNTSQTKSIKTILKKFNPILRELIDKKSSKNDINKQVKLMDLEVYKILNNKQFIEYKKVKVELESFKRYRQ